MKRLLQTTALLLCTLLFSAAAFAQNSGGINTTFFVLSINGGANTFYDLQAGTSNTDFNGANLGTFCQGSSTGIVFKGAEHNVYKCGSCDLTSTRVYYRIYTTGSPSGSFLSNNISFASDFANGCGGRDQKWAKTDYAVNLLSGLAAGNYTIEVYSDATTTCSGTVYAGNGGANYKATFTVNANVTYYRDADNDGYGNPAIASVSCTGAPAGYVANNTDCNDGNASMHAKYPFYSNTDGDIYGDGELILVCAVDANTAPAGYSNVTGDCDPSDGTKWQSGDFYIDQDGDGYDNGLAQVCYGSAFPVGYIVNTLGSDCDDTNNAIHTIFSFYVDADQDGYGKGNLVPVCAAAANMPPVGYSLTNNDCDDTNKFVNPGSEEIYYNGIDDNCAGGIDEGRQLTSQLVAGRCGSTLAKIYHSVNVDFRTPGTTGYRFRVTNQSNNDVQTIERPNAYFNFNQLQRYEYGTAYTVEVELQRNGIWLGYYGTGCTINTPDVAKLAVCGGTVATKGTFIFSEVLLYATAYRFEVTNTVTNQTTPIENGRHYFTFNEISGFAAGVEYSVKVSVKTTGDWSVYGAPCLITAPGGTAPEIPTDKAALATTTAFNAVAFPNPFAGSFNVDVTTSLNDNVNVKVYDMLGKLVENREVNATDVSQQQLGNNYPAGVYNIIVTQGENLKTLRVIKR